MGTESLAKSTLMSSLKQQLSNLQSSIDRKSRGSTPGRTRSRSGSRSRKPSRERHGVSSKSRNKKKSVKLAGPSGGAVDKAVRDKATSWKVQHHDLDFTRARKALGETLEKKKIYEAKLSTAVKDDMYLKCEHSWSYSMAGWATKSDGVCQKCKVQQSKVDEKAPIKAVNTDDLKTLYDMVCKEFDMARNAMRAGLKDKPIKIQLSMAFLITTTITSGVTNTTSMGGNSNAIYLSNSSEWSSISSLFDEMKCTHGHVDFVYKNPNSLSTTVDCLANDLPVIGFDPVDRTATTSSTQLTELAQHKILNPFYGPTAAGTTAPVVCPAGGLKHEFSFHIPPGTMTDASGNGYVGRQWVSIDGAGSEGYGKLKFYHIGLVITANNTGAGIIKMFCEFRCRE